MSEFANKLKLYPNPLIGNTLNIDFGELSEATKFDISIFSMDGSEVFSTKVISSQSTQLKNLPFLTKGVYMVKATSNKVEKHTKLCVD